MKKIKAMLGSVSFWFSILGAITLLLGQWEVIPNDVAVIIAGWFGVGVSQRLVSKAVNK